MYCPKCGKKNDDASDFCVECAEPLRDNVRVASRASAPKIASHIAPAILCTLFCCLPFGIVAIVYAAQVNSKAGQATTPGLGIQLIRPQYGAGSASL